MGGAGEAAQDQDAVVVVACGHELLGDQVHAVVQRGHHAEIRQPVKDVDFPVVVMTLAVHDRLPATLAQVGVERAHHLSGFFLHRLIARDAAAARRRDLDERESPPVLRPALKEAA